MFSNRLAHETSPYLLQHAHNPVDWYPWGAEAFEAARQQNRPIFLSVGYSTCYWCHVMERQSFENESIAAEMNRRFINIKVDREERPDVDQLYMNAVQALSGQGGWPMSVFLAPDLRPFYGGTYYPPADAHGRIGFPRLLVAVDDAWHNRRGEIDRMGDELVQVLHRMAQPPLAKGPIQIDEAFIEDLLDRSTSDYDPEYGGFGSAPKFPRETLLELILVHQRHSPNDERMKQLLHTLDAMANGGIRDHLGGAFHRYSTDDHWLVPHFEIMLYDNAMLAWVYAEAYAQTNLPRYASVARGILDFVLREMTSPQGAFYTAIDAEVDAQEGLSYLWTAEEIAEVLGADAEFFNRVYGVSAGPNFADPHHGNGVPDKNILHLSEPIAANFEEKLAPMRQALYAQRRQRKQPLLDTKVLTSWNALMIRALAHAGNVLKEARYTQAAAKAADFLLETHRNVDGALCRVSRDGQVKGMGFLDDYAFMVRALLDCGRLNQARELADWMREKFLDRDGGGFFFTSEGDKELIVRQKTGSDTPLPSGNAVAAAVMLELNQDQIAQGTLNCFAGQIQNYGQGMSAMVQTAFQYFLRHGPLSVGGSEIEAKDIVTLSANWSRPDVLDVRLSIADGYHINAYDAGGGLTPTRLSVSGELVAVIDYPAGEKKVFPFADRPISIYDGQISIIVRFAHAVVETPVTLQLQFQPCDQTSCQAVKNKKLVVK
jgi:uncharacterized protein